MEEKEEKGWSIAKVVFGRLIQINKERKEIIIETKVPDAVEGEGWMWIENTYTINNWSDEEIQNTLLPYLDEDIKIQVLDSEVVSIITP